MHHLLNWSWQGILVAVAAHLALGVLGRSRAHARYLLCWGAIVAVLALPLLATSAGTMIAAPAPDASAIAAAPLSLPSAWWSSRTPLLILWVAWAAICGARLATEALALRRARARCRPFPGRREPGLRFWRAVSGGGRTARLVLSDDVRCAAVLAAGSPVIAVAPALLGELSDDELDRIVVHEWAHVQRRDDVLNFAHAGVRLLAGWHPAIWWLQRLACLEREAACDEIAVAVTGSAPRYAASLVTVAGLMPFTTRPLAAPGLLSASSLSRRVVRILASGQLASPGRSSCAAGSVVLLLAGGSVCAARYPLVAAVHAAPASVPGEAGSQRGRVLPPPAAAVAAGAAHSTRAAGVRTPSRTREPQRRVRTDGDPAGNGRVPSPAPGRAASATVRPAAAADLPAPLSELPARADVLRNVLPQAPVSGPPAETPSRSQADAGSPWGTAAGAGLAVGRGSRKAASATSGFFTRFGNRIASTF